MIAGIWMIVGGAFGAVCGALAVGRNRSAVAWWFAGCIGGPVALLVLLRRPDRLDQPPALL